MRRQAALTHKLVRPNLLYLNHGFNYPTLLAQICKKVRIREGTGHSIPLLIAANDASDAAASAAASGGGNSGVDGASGDDGGGAGHGSGSSGGAPRADVNEVQVIVYSSPHLISSHLPNPTLIIIEFVTN